MLYCFALTPDVFEPWAITGENREGVIVVEILRGMSDNGLLADLESGQWLREVLRIQSRSNVSADLRDKIKACLNTLHDRHRIIRHPCCKNPPKNAEYKWLYWALERHHADARHPFQGVFVTQEFLELSELVDDILVALPAALDSDRWLGRKRTARFTKTWANLRTNLSPLLRYAQVVNLIDPYMTPRKERFFNTVQHCADLLGKRDGKHERGQIRIHAGDPLKDPEPSHQELARDRLVRWEQALRPVVKQFPHTYKVHLWKSRPAEKLFHDRYIITDQCGVSAPGGLDFGDDGIRANVTTWTLLEPEVASEVIQREFNGPKSPYELLGKPLIVRP